MKIKILTNEDVHLYSGLIPAILNMRGRLDLSSRLWFIFVDKKNQWLGFGGYRQIDETRVYFGPTFVKEEFRGLGLQKKLIRARLRRAKKDGYKEAISSIYSYNYISGNNLIQMDFKLCRIPTYYDTESDEVWFKKIL